jgi:hypothetical protein
MNNSLSVRGGVSTDVFALAKAHYTVADVWHALSLPGEPKQNCRSPFREESSPSFSVYSNGKMWKDHGSGEGGDVIEFLKFGIGGDYSDVRDWLRERIGIDALEGAPCARPDPFLEETESDKGIQWPFELLEGSERTWEQFAGKRGYSYESTWMMVQLGVLRFGKLKNKVCYAVTDRQRRAAEIRKVSGRTFFTDAKIYPLKGVKKTWLIGAALLGQQDDIFVCEGAKDLLAALDAYFRYKKAGGERQWCSVAALGAKVRRFDSDLLLGMRGRHVRLCPDGDDDGDDARNAWTKAFNDAGASVDCCEMPRGRDLSDVAGEVEPEVFFA